MVDKQTNECNCGVFARALATSLCYTTMSNDLSHYQIYAIFV